MDDIISGWDSFETFLEKKFKKFENPLSTRWGLTTDFQIIEPTFQSDFGNFDKVEDKVRSFFFTYQKIRIIETEIPNIRTEEVEFYFQTLKNSNIQMTRNFLFKISKIDEEGWYEIIFAERESIYDSSIYFSDCLNRAYEKFQKFHKLADVEETKVIGYNFSNSEMNQENFFEERVQAFCLHHEFNCISEPNDGYLPKWTITDTNNQKCSLTISNIQGGPCIFFQKLAPSAVLGEYETDKNDLLIHLAQDLKNEFETFKELFKGELDTEVPCLLDVEKWFLVEGQPQSWKENYVAIEKVRKQFEKMIDMIDTRHSPVNPESLSPPLTEHQLREKLKRWFKKLLELHFGLRARQLRSRKKYKLFYEHRITNAIAEHIMDEPGVNEAFAHFVKILPRHARMRGGR